MSERVPCPHCGNEVSISDALARGLKEKLERESSAKVSELTAAVEKREREVELAKVALMKQKETLEADVQQRISEEQDALVRKATKLAEDRVAGQQQLRENELERLRQDLRKSQSAEAVALRKSLEVEQREKNLDLEVQRKLGEEKAQLFKQASEQHEVEHQIKLREKELQLEGMRKQIEDLRKKSEQGSQQSQGEAAEVHFEDVLRELFPLDEIEEIKKGESGADLLQVVRSHSGKVAGKIYWEIKRTKHWQPRWVEKSKADVRDREADFGVIASSVVPEGVKPIGQEDGIWICTLSALQGMAQVLRGAVLELHRTRTVNSSTADHKETLFRYVTGTGFRQKIESIVEIHAGLKDDLDRERKALTRIWASREKRLETMITDVSTLFGDFEGVLGGQTLLPVDGLQLEWDGCEDGIDAENEAPVPAVGKRK